MRIVKDGEERRAEILSVAERLFATKGFDGTSTADLLKEIGIARGTLYYHFESKEAILDALIERQTDLLLQAAREIAENKDISVDERLVLAVLALSMKESDAGQEFIDQIHRPQNALMHQKIQKKIITKVPAILTSIVQDGIKAGVFDTPFPYECMEMFVAYANVGFDQDLLELTKEEEQKRLTALIFHVERLLGARPGILATSFLKFTESKEAQHGKF